MTTIPTLRSILRATRSPLVSYAITLAGSLLLMVLVVVGIALGDDGASSDDPSSNLDIEAIGTLVGMPAQLAAMALGGSLRLGAGDDAVALFAPPLLLTALFFVVAFRSSRKAEEAAPVASTVERLILATASSFGLAVVVTVVTRLLAMRDDGIAMHAASAGLFFFTFLLAAAAGFLGRQAAARSLWPPFLPADARRAIHLVAQHVVGWVVVLMPLIAIWALVEADVATAIFTLVWGPTAGLIAFALGHFGAWSVWGEQVFSWDLGWFAGLALPVLAVAATLVVSIAWHLRRGHDRELLAQPISWVYLPLTYAGGATVVALGSTVSISASLFDDSMSLTFYTAYWLIPVLAVWGGLIETLSRYVAPALAGAVPAGIARRLAKGPAQLVSPAAEPTQRIPMSPADKARAKKGLIATGVIAGVALVGFITVSIVGSSVYSAENQARAYLDALVEGDLEGALEIAPVDDAEGSLDLLTDDVYAETDDRITGYEIVGVESEGSSAVVTVDLEGPEEGDGVELYLTASGSRAVLFDDWTIDEGGLANLVTVSVPEDSDTLTANGVDVAVSGGQDVDLWAMPGTYAFNPYADIEWLEPGTEVTSVPAADMWGIYAEVGSPLPSDALKERVDTELTAWVEECMQATELEPTDCPQSAYGMGDEARNVTWSLVSTPVVDWDGFYGEFPAELSTTGGEAEATYEYDDSYGYGKAHWVEETESADLWVDVTVDIVDGEPVVTFEDY